MKKSLLFTGNKKIIHLFPYIKERKCHEKKDRETLTPSSFSFAAAYLASEFYSAKKPGSLLKPDTCFTESFREQALSSALYAELEERVHSDGEFADLLTTTMLNGKFFPKYLSGNREAYLRFKPKAYYDLRSCHLSLSGKTWKIFPFQSETIEKYGKRFFMKTPLALPEAMVEAGRTKAAISLAGFLNPDFIL